MSLLTSAHGSYIECDKPFGDRECTSRFPKVGMIGEQSTITNDALKKGWSKNFNNGRWTCPECRDYFAHHSEVKIRTY